MTGTVSPTAGACHPLRAVGVNRIRSPSGVSNITTGRGGPSGGPGSISTTVPEVWIHASLRSRWRRSDITVLPAIAMPITNSSTPASVARTGYSAIGDDLRDFHADRAADPGPAQAA